MKDRALATARGETDSQLAKNLLREYLHHLILRELFEQNLLETVVFHGGTAIRILFELNRFSEDLDFHIKGKKDFNFKFIIDNLQKHLTMQGYRLTFKNKLEGYVQSSFIKFEDILYEAGLSHQKGEKLNIKIEIDTKPPGGFKVDYSLINKYFPFGLIHHNRETFLAGKLHAILQRSYTKGRDFYDLWFYLSRWKETHPNFTYLNNALKQTGFKGPEVSVDNWRELIREKIEEIDWENVKSDVEPFIQDRQDLRLFKKQFLLKLLFAI
jgi:predicted nucleotidyltransferase component of viral defense system